MNEEGFVSYKRSSNLLAQPLSQTAPYNFVVQATAGIRSWCRPDASHSEESSRSKTAWELGTKSFWDGRLDVGVHLPLLAKRYRFLSLLGEGTSAQVILAQDTLQPTRGVVAIKTLKRQFTVAGQKEARILRWLADVAPHSAICPLQDVFIHANHICLVMPRLYHSLLDVIVLSSTWSAQIHLKYVRELMIQLLATLADLHSHGLVHADLKPENILFSKPLDETGSSGCADTVQLIDFGTSFSVTAIDTAKVSFEAQSLPYRAPEVVLRKPLGPAMDVWSLGCITTELILHQPLFPADSPSRLLAQIHEALGSEETSSQKLIALSSSSRRTLQPSTRPLNSWLEQSCHLQLAVARLDIQAADLVMQMLTLDPDRRITAAQALRHPFFARSLPLRHSPQQQAAPLPRQPAPPQARLTAAQSGDGLHASLPVAAANARPIALQAAQDCARSCSQLLLQDAPAASQARGPTAPPEQLATGDLKGEPGRAEEHDQALQEGIQSWQPPREQKGSVRDCEEHLAPSVVKSVQPVANGLYSKRKRSEDAEPSSDAIQINAGLNDHAGQAEVSKVAKLQAKVSPGQQQQEAQSSRGRLTSRVTGSSNGGPAVQDPMEEVGRIVQSLQKPQEKSTCSTDSPDRTELSSCKSVSRSTGLRSGDQGPSTPPSAVICQPAKSPTALSGERCRMILSGDPSLQDPQPAKLPCTDAKAANSKHSRKASPEQQSSAPETTLDSSVIHSKLQQSATATAVLSPAWQMVKEVLEEPRARPSGKIELGAQSKQKRKSPRSTSKNKVSQPRERQPPFTPGIPKLDSCSEKDTAAATLTQLGTDRFARGAVAKNLTKRSEVPIACPVIQKSSREPQTSVLRKVKEEPAEQISALEPKSAFGRQIPSANQDSRTRRNTLGQLKKSWWIV